MKALITLLSFTLLHYHVEAQQTPLHVIEDTTVADRRFRILTGTTDSIDAYIIEYNGHRDSFMMAHDIAGFDDNLILCSSKDHYEHPRYKFINDSMVVAGFPISVYQRTGWILYRAVGAEVIDVTGGMAGPPPLYVDQDHHRILNAGPLRSKEPNLVKFYREITIYDYERDKISKRKRTDKSIYFDDDFIGFYKSIK